MLPLWIWPGKCPNDNQHVFNHEYNQEFVVYLADDNRQHRLPEQSGPIELNDEQQFQNEQWHHE